jgi:hypothetical protein
MGRKFLTKKGIGIRSALRQSLVSWLSISRKKASLFLQMTQSRGSNSENEIHTMIKHSNEYATRKKFADKKNLEIYLPEMKAKDNCCVHLVIFWSIHNAQILTAVSGGGQMSHIFVSYSMQYVLT